jgi:hypothetical protein
MTVGLVGWGVAAARAATPWPLDLEPILTSSFAEYRPGACTLAWISARAAKSASRAGPPATAPWCACA